MTIINRLRSAESGSRELDADVSKTCGWRYVENRDVGSPHLWGWYGMSPEGHSGPIPTYTTSIDAALALVEKMLPGWLVKLNKRVVPGWSVRLTSPSFDFFYTNDFDGEEFPQSAPLAILTALFTALEAKDTAP